MYIKYEDLCPYCKHLAEQFNIKMNKVQKLVNNLCDKTKYVVHYRVLKGHTKVNIELVQFSCGEYYYQFTT